MKRIKIMEGRVEIREAKYSYEFYSDNLNVFVKIYHPGVKGDVTIFTRNDKVGLKADMDMAMVRSGVFLS